MKYFSTLVILICIACVTYAQVPVDTINVGNHHLQTHYLKPGLKQYLVYYQQPTKPQILRFWFWVRDIKQQQLNGEAIFVTDQHWYGQDTVSYRTVRSINRQADFAPLYHAENIGGKLKAYTWTSKNITGTDTVQNNLAKNFTLNFDRPTLNWNLDIETFEMLPLAQGKTFALNFYDAGLSPPKYVTYTVTGSEVIALLDNTKADCWKLYTEGKSPNGSTYTETYWISKKNHEFLKEEDNFNGMFRYKIKLSGAAPDLLARFK